MKAGVFKAKGEQPVEMAEAIETGDTFTFHTGERVMVTSVTVNGYALKSLNGRGRFLLTPAELEQMLG